MKSIAFFGAQDEYARTTPDNWRNFMRYNLEIPWYFCRDGINNVHVVTENVNDTEFVMLLDQRTQVQFSSISEKDFYKTKYDVIIHWRKWHDKCCNNADINLLHTCDHLYSNEWINDVKIGNAKNKLDGVLCYRTWHKRNMMYHLPFVDKDIFYTDVTLGVDTEIYFPKDKIPFTMLWASDPGRGLQGCLELFLKMYQQDKRWKLTVCWPYYVNIKPWQIKHPGITWAGSINNGPKLWNLFNETAFLPYTSTFYEPSSRAHRQGQAAGCIVLYPPNMGSPSELIRSDVDGIVAPIHEWPSIMTNLYSNTDKYRDIMLNARCRAVSENWAVQANNFNNLVDKIKEKKL